MFRELRRSAIARGAFAVVLIYFLLALFGPWIAPYDPTGIVTMPRMAPSAEHWFGTDEIGRDILSRMLVGARTAFTVGAIAVSIGLGIGGVIGIAAAYFGRWIDGVLMRVVDVMLAFPGLLLALAVITFLGPGLTNTMIAIGIGGIPGYARLMRGEVLALLERDFVSAARSLGAGDLRIMGRHLLPLSISPLVVYSTAQLARAILAEAGLSYLGLGVQPPDPSWGGMIASGQRYLFNAPFMAIFPGTAIIVLVFGLNLLGDSLRDALNPLLRDRGDA